MILPQEIAMDGTLELLNGLAGLAALVNSLLMWPTIRYLKRLEPRVEALEKAAAGKPKRKRGRIVGGRL